MLPLLQLPPRRPCRSIITVPHRMELAAELVVRLAVERAVAMAALVDTHPLEVAAAVARRDLAALSRHKCR